MGALPDNISALVFKGSVKGDLGKFSLDSQMLKVLMALDGKRNLAAVARSVSMNMDTLKGVLDKLQQLQLVEQVDAAVHTLNDDFFDFLKHQLSLALGPIAEILIEDEIQDLSDTPGQLAFHQAAELVNQLARQIPRQENKVAFQQAMAQKIKEIKP